MLEIPWILIIKRQHRIKYLFSKKVQLYNIDLTDWSCSAFINLRLDRYAALIRLLKLQSCKSLSAALQKFSLSMRAQFANLQWMYPWHQIRKFNLNVKFSFILLKFFISEHWRFYIFFIEKLVGHCFIVFQPPFLVGYLGKWTLVFLSFLVAYIIFILFTFLFAILFLLTLYVGTHIGNAHFVFWYQWLLYHCNAYPMLCLLEFGYWPGKE